MVLSKKALDNFLSRPLRNLEELKHLPPAVIDAKLKALGATWVTEPMHHQKVALVAALTNTSAYLLLDPGLGKGHPDWTPILTPTGFCDLENINIGDYVIGQNGCPKLVLNKFNRGVLRTFRVYFSDGSSVACDEDHLWKVRDKEGEWQVKSTATLLHEGLNDSDGGYKWEIPLTEPVQFKAPLELPIDPYLLGVLLANGSLAQFTPVYVTNDTKLVAIVMSKVPEGTTHTVHKTSSEKMKSYGLRKTKGSKLEALSIKLSRLGLFPRKGDCKFIPGEYLHASIRDRIELLQGLMDCDGLSNYDPVYGALKFSCRAPQLAADIRFLVRSLGGTCEIEQIKGYRQAANWLFNCFIRLPERINPFLIYGHEYKPKKKLQPSRIIHKIEYDSTQQVYCLSVQDELYLTTDFIVTHNTKVSLDALNSRRNHVKKTLVLVPGVSNIGAWLDEIAIHAPHLTAIGFYDMSKAQKKKAIEANHNVVIMTYMGWLALLGLRKIKGKRDIDAKFIDQVERQFQMVIWDEADAIKSRSTLTFKAAERLMKKVPYRLALSGTPFDKNPIDLWSQFYVLDYGHALGENIALFRQAFCTEKYNPFSRSFDYVFNPKKTAELSARIKHTAIIYKEGECFDLPDTVGGLLTPSFMVRSVPFPKENLDHYNSIVEELKYSKDKQELQNVYLRMRQLTAGFIPIVDEGVRNNILFDKNPKMEALLDLLHEIPADAKVLIFNEFKMSGEVICDGLTKAGITNTRIFSGTADKIGAMNAFKSDPKIRALVGSRSVCYGLNLQVANHLIVYESPDSTIKRTQLERRIRRYGQTKTTFIYDLAVVGSVDFKILKALRSGKALIDELLSSDNPYDVIK